MPRGRIQHQTSNRRPRRNAPSTPPSSNAETLTPTAASDPTPSTCAEEIIDLILAIVRLLLVAIFVAFQVGLTSIPATANAATIRENLQAVAEQLKNISLQAEIPSNSHATDPTHHNDR